MIIYYLLLIIFTSFSLRAHDTNDIPHILQDLERKRQSYENERITQAFSVIDDLFKKSVIKIQKLDENQEVLRERTASLYNFLSKPHKKNKILELLNSKPEIIDYISQHDFTSFLDTVQQLYEQKLLSLSDANNLILQHAPMSADEIIRLVENGACLTESGYFIQLRTGNTYGNALKLEDDVALVFRKLRDEDKIDLPKEPLLTLLDGTHREHLLRSFSSAGLSVPDALSDAHVLSEMRKFFSFLSSINRIPALSLGSLGSPGAVNPVDASYIMLSPSQFSSIILGNFYLQNIDASISNSISVNPLGLGYSGNMAFATHGPDWWLYYTDGYLGGGFDYTINFDQGAQWSSGYASYLTLGGAVSGWKNQISAGITMQTVLARGIGAGASVFVTISREHDVAFLDTYPKDGKFAAIRGLHRIEIIDKKTRGASGAVAFNFSATGVPLAVAFKAGAEFTRDRTYSTHTKLGQAHEMLAESDLSNLLFKAGKKIKKSRIPSFEDPEVLIDGDELVEIKIGKLSGAFVIGLQTIVPVYALRAGTNIDLIAEFELGLRRLPNDKFEVSIEPRRVYELSLFGSMLNIFGAGQVASMAVARKQIFLFDFKIPEARLAYFDLIHQGRLPSYDEIDISTEDRGPEHLLAEFRAHNKILTHRGIERTFLEAVAIKTAKSFAGFNAPIIPAMLFLVNKAHDAMRKRHPKLNLQFEGKDREFMHSQSSSVATNGLVAVRRITSGGRVSHGQGFSGRYNQDLFVTHRRIHTILEKPDDGTQNTWAFDKLVLHAQFEDTVITGNEENSMAELVNKLFSAYIGSFEYKNSKSPRIINIERELKKTEIDKLLSSESKERITIASQASGIDQDKIYYFLKKLKHKHTDQQGLIIKQFVESNAGFTGFAAVHQLLGAHPEDISISTESGYSEVIEKANNFIIIYSYSLDNKKEKKVIFDAHKSKKNIKIIRKFYQHARVLLREIDQQLRLLYDDKYLIDHKSPLYKIYGEKKVKELVEKGVRQDKTAVKSALVSARQTILELMDLSTQKFTQKERLRIYELAKRKNLRLAEHAELFIHDNFMKIYDQQESKIGHDLLAKLETRIRALSDDTIMNELDPEYVKNQVALWMSLSEWLKKILLIWHERILVVPS